MESKRSKKGRKSRPAESELPSNQQQEQQPHQHHPWDEDPSAKSPQANRAIPSTGTALTRFLTCMAPVIVSLPGAGTGPTEQPTILLINGIASDSQLEDKQSKAAALKLALDNNNSEASAPAQPHQVPTTPGGSHLLDFESHLIESIADEASGVGIRELTPFEQELQQGSSKAGTNDTDPVIEVEPAGVRTKQPVEISPPAHQIAEVDETATPSEEVRRTAEQLVDEIEEELIQALSRDVDEAQRVHEDQVQRDRDEISALTQQVEVQLNELTGILKNKPQAEIVLELPAEEEEEKKPKPFVAAPSELKLVEVPTPKTEAEEQERKEFIDSLPQIEQNRLQGGSGSEETDAQKLSADCKREYYQSLKKYLLHSSQEKPPVPLQTYRWEDLKRAKERGGYPWTHLYKRPLGPDEQPEIVLLLRKSQELRFKSESPKSLKKVRYDEQVLVKETERYIQDLSEDEAVATTTDDSSEESSDSETESERDQHNEDALSECISCVSDSVLAVGGHARPRKTNRLAHIRDLIRRRRSGRTHEDAQSLPGNSANPSRQSSVHELAPPPGSLIPNADKPPKSSKPKQGFDIMKKLKSLAERQKKRLNIKRITLKKDDKIVLGEQQKIMKLKASPKSDRGEIPHFIEKQDSDEILELVEYDESPCRKRTKEELLEDQPSGSGRVPEPDEIIELPVVKTEIEAPKVEVTEPAEEKLDNKDEKESEAEEDPPKKTPRIRREHVYEEIGQAGSQELVNQPILELESLKKSLTRQDNLAIDEIEAAKAVPLDRMGSSEEEQVTAGKPGALFAPISSIDSTSSDEDRARLAQLSPVTEESDEPMDISPDLRPSLKKEASPAPSDKKVTFSHVEDEAEPHREDVELPEDVLEAATNAAKWKNESDHEYEPVGVTPAHESSPAPSPQSELQLPMDIDLPLSSAGTTPRTESRTDYEIHTSQVDSSALEELPLQPENRRKGFMASAQDRTKKMQDGIRLQAGKLRTRLQTKPKPKPVSGSPKGKAKDRRRFKAPEFSKIKMPEIRRPDMSKLKELKRPEFTKFNKPDMSKFKLPEKLSTLKLRRSKSFKENEGEVVSDETPEGTGGTASPTQPAPKKKFEFNFGTYPRAFRKKKPVEEPVAVATESSLGTEGLSVIPSTETQPSQTSTSSPQGDRGPGPVRSRWADKFSDVSYNDSEGSRYRRFGSELESFDRESSLERRMKEDLEGTEDTASEAQPQQEMGILGVVADSKQFAEFDEENRAIHEISSKRSREFKRRPMVHQDSDLRSEDSRDAEGWTEKDIQKNKLLRKAELEAEAGFYKFHDLQDAQSTASSGKKVVMETIDDDEFFLRKRGISEDNIQLRQYISEAIREGYDMPNALKHVGYSAEQVPAEYGDYDVPPAKPRRLHRNYQPDFDSQEFQRSDYGDDLSMSQNGSEFTPKRPLRKARSRSKYSIEGSQDIPQDGGSSIQYFEDDEEYLRPPARDQPITDSEQALNNLDLGGKAAAMIQEEMEQELQNKPRPQAPRRQKKRTRDDASVDKDADSFINGFGGRSVSNTFLQPHEDVIVYRTEHEYRHIPLATPDRFTDATSARTQRSEDDRTSRGADSLILDGHIKSRAELEDNEDVGPRTRSDEKFVIDMLESDGYESQKEKPKQPEEEDDYEEPGALDRSNLQSGAVINKMKFRPLPPPPRPPREKRSMRAGSQTHESYEDSEQVASSSQADSYDQGEFEVEVSTQTDPLPDDFVCEEFEITEDMKIIEPRRSNGSGNKTLEDLLRSVEAAQEQDEVDGARVLSEDEQLAKGLQRFRDANQRSMSERSRASSQADRSKSLSRPQTPSSAVIIERRVPTPSLTAGEDDATVQASLIVRPISAADLIDDDLRREEEELRREGLLSDSSVQSKSDVEDEHGEVALSDYAASTADLDAAVEQLQQAHLESDYESRLEDDEVERTLRDSEYEEEKFSEQEEEQETTQLEKELTEQELEEALEKELQEAMEKELSDYRQREKEQESEQEQTFSEEELAASEIDYHQSEEEQATSEVDYHPSEDEHPLSDGEQPLSEEEHTLFDTEHIPTEPETQKAEETIHKSTASEPTEAEVELKFVATLPTEPAFGDKEEEPEEPPLPPPRRKSTTALEPIATTALTIAEQSSRELTPIQTVQSAPEPQFPSHLAELEVERLRVHALQAGQIQVSQLHGNQVKADDLQCKSGQLVVQNIELPPGFIDDIVERVQREQRPSLLTTETQTSRQASSEPATSEKELPVKPPRHSKTTEQVPPASNLDEQTQTDAGLLPLPPPPAAYPSVEYLQSLAPLAFFNLQRSAEAEQAEGLKSIERKAPHKCRRRHVQEPIESETGSEPEEQLVERPRSRSRRSRTRSATQPLDEDYDEDQPKTVAQAGRNFASACSLELVNIINQLTHYVRGDAMEPQQATRNMSALVIFFIVITLAVLVFLLTGRQVHTHHWDYFNPPGNDHGRQT
ncbi:trichohyalin isoform X4 [Drosophila mauritiana]|uniref:Trichohyalin isoform X4 n=1 Tax=Drosophila mauritiana TaxID=7226 RepID=A0A6P8JYX7_DROMA|nr:trichohyalin isoform X4 [Drosophila mauritiana]